MPWPRDSRVPSSALESSGDSVGLHPVWVVLALSIGGFFLGFLGLLIGVPLAVGVKLLLIRGVARYRESGFFLGRDGRSRGRQVRLK